MNLAKLMSDKRKEENLSVREAARRVGCNPMVISRVESGEAPSAQNLAKIVEWLGLRSWEVAEVVKEFG